MAISAIAPLLLSCKVEVEVFRHFCFNRPPPQTRPNDESPRAQPPTPLGAPPKPADGVAAAPNAGVAAAAPKAGVLEAPNTEPPAAPVAGAPNAVEPKPPAKTI